MTKVNIKNLSLKTSLSFECSHDQLSFSKMSSKNAQLKNVDVYFGVCYSGVEEHLRMYLNHEIVGIQFYVPKAKLADTEKVIGYCNKDIDMEFVGIFKILEFIVVINKKDKITFDSMEIESLGDGTDTMFVTLRKKLSQKQVKEDLYKKYFDL